MKPLRARPSGRGVVVAVLLVLLWVASVGAAALAAVFARSVSGLGASATILAAAGTVLAVATLGALAAAREPRRLFGWMTMGMGLGLSVVVLAHQYVSFAVGRKESFAISVDWAALISDLTLPGLLLAAPFLLLLGPEGRWHSRGWRYVTLPLLAVCTVSLALIALSPGPLQTIPEIANPIGVGFFAGAETLALWLGAPAAGFALLVAIFALPRAPDEAEEEGEKELSPRKLRKREKRRRKAEGPKYAWDFLRDFPRVLPYVRPYWPLAAASIGMIGVGVMVGLLVPWPLGILIDSVLGRDPLPSLLGFLAGWDRTDLLILAVVSGLVITALVSSLGVVESYVLTRLEQRMTLDVRSDLFEHAQGLSQAFHDQKKTGGLMFAINMQAASLGAVTVALPPLAQALGTLIGMFVIAFMIDAELALIALTVVPFIYVSTVLYAKRIEPRLYYVRNLEADSMSIVYEAMAMLRVIVTFGREKYEHRRFYDQAEEAVNARINLTVRQTLFQLVISVLTATGTALVLGVGAWHVLRNELTAGELLVVMAYIAAVYMPLQEISATIATLQEQFISLRGALDLFDREADIKESPDAVAIDRARGHVAFDRVSFKYSGRKRTLERISFDAPPLSRIGIVGPTGAGKTTLVNLIPRFYDAKKGRVLIDGIDVKELTLASLRAQISVVHQEPLLFAISIEENIRYGRLDATKDEVVEAAAAANAHEFVAALPNGYDTILGEGGALLSMGERQRIAIARAFLKDAPILILDEPTASIDSKTEQVILEALDRLAAHRTTFLIAHRLSTLRDADLILVIEDGRVVQRGSHDELVSEDGLYSQLYEAQGRRTQFHLVEELGAELPGPSSRPAPSDADVVTALRTLLEAPPEELDSLATRSSEPLEIRLAAGILAVLTREDVTRLRQLDEADLAAMFDEVRR